MKGTSVLQTHLNRFQPGSFPICHQVIGTAFAFYTPEQIHKISVKKITNPSALDMLGNPIKDGLYDPSLGPIDSNAM
jgi:DNA-directed RNA polymerase I subunit RPA1